MSRTLSSTLEPLGAMVSAAMGAAAPAGAAPPKVDISSTRDGTAEPEAAPPLGAGYFSGEFMLKGHSSWADSRNIKRRHFIIEGDQLKLFGRRGRTFKGSITLDTVTALRPTTDPTAPPAAIELVTEPERSPAVAERQQGAAGTASRPAGAAAARASAAYACTFVISADGSESDQFLAQLRAAVPESATSELALKARLGRWATTGWQPSDYTLGKTLGVGTFGKVKLATDPSGRQVAVKLISRSKLLGTNQLGRLTKEISILKCLRHPHVIYLHDVFHTPREIMMVMEYVGGGDLLALLNSRYRLRTPDVQSIFWQIVAAVAFCHSLGVAHRDLKPENILIEATPRRAGQPAAQPPSGGAGGGDGAAAGGLDAARRSAQDPSATSAPRAAAATATGRAPAAAPSAAPPAPRSAPPTPGIEFDFTAKVADFGLSTLVSAGEFLQTQCGSPHYVAPEVLNFDGTSAYDGCEADAWSLGVILYVLLCHKLPFEAENTALLYQKIRGGIRSLPPRVPADAAALVQQILVVEPSARLTAAQMVDHPWLNPPGAGESDSQSDDDGDVGGAGGVRAGTRSAKGVPRGLAARSVGSMLPELASFGGGGSDSFAAAAALGSATGSPRQSLGGGPLGAPDPLGLALLTTMGTSPPSSSASPPSVRRARWQGSSGAAPSGAQQPPDITRARSNTLSMRLSVAVGGGGGGPGLGAMLDGDSSGGRSRANRAGASQPRRRLVLSRTVDALVDVDPALIARVAASARLTHGSRRRT